MRTVAKNKRREKREEREKRERRERRKRARVKCNREIVLIPNKS
jgi:hypothetical protein